MGDKVAQIQAVLARRCAGIGELQQHLLRAGWQRGVAQWGVLGQGGQWATIQGTTVRTEETAAVAASASGRQQQQQQQQLQQHMRYNSIGESMADMNMGTFSSHSALPPHLDKIGTANEISAPWNHSKSKRNKEKKKKLRRETGYYASVFVRNENDGKILMDDAALAEWSVDAMELIRNLLFRASNGKLAVPYEENWKPLQQQQQQQQQQQDTVGLPMHESPEQSTPQRESSFGGESSDTDKEGQQRNEQLNLDEEHQQPIMYADPQRQLPRWAKWAPKRNPDEQEAQDRSPNDTVALGEEEVVICNLPLMAAEVSALLNSIEEIMPIQKHRRLRRLRPPSMFRRRWYLSAVAAPMVSYAVYHLVEKGLGSKVVRLAVSKIVQFFKERVYQPTLAM